MQVESAIELLLPTVQYGNIKLFHRVGLDTNTDKGRIAESTQTLGIKAEPYSSEAAQTTARRLALGEIIAMKKEIEKTLSSSDYELKK